MTLKPDPAHDTTGNGTESHYDLARQLEMRGYTVGADSEDNEHSEVFFDGQHVGDIRGDAEATVTSLCDESEGSTAQHSIAPWRDETGTVFAADDSLVCEVHGGDGRRFIDDEDNAECLANKRLILAAPQMLEALRDVQKAHQDMFDVMPVAWQTFAHIVDEAIKEATGQK